MNRILVCCLALLWCALAGAQTYVELVLDASGSMWNKLDDGEYRIVAAKDVLASFVSGLPADPNLNVGLRVYGSRLKALDPGACEDSELFVPLAGIARDALLQTVQNTNAVGATPIARSLELAAADFPDGAARRLIVLVTDGEESCGGDVRATLESLEAQGIAFDLKIIGFDLDEAAVASFAGLGDFVNATSAADLAAALGRAVEVTAPASYAVTVTLTRDGVPAKDGAAVTFVDAVTGEAYPLTAEEPGTLSAELPAGAYSARLEDAFTDSPQEVSGLSVTPEAENRFSFELATEAEVVLSVEPSEPVTGSRVTVRYEGAPASAGAWITVVPADAPDEVYLAYANVTGERGSLELAIPGETAPLEARYHLKLPEGGSRVIGRSAPFTPVQATATLEVPAEVAAGTAFEVSWTGPNNERDYLTVVPAAAEDGSYREYHYTREGSPLTFTAPITPGTYELRYQSDGTTGLIARRAFTVVASEITLTVPAEVEAGKPFEISWSGPDGDRDYLTVVPAAAPDQSYQEYYYTREGSPLTFTAPIEPGQYELRYQSDREGGVFARQAFMVAGTEISLQAPASVMAGSPFEVSWSGPDGDRDYLTIVPAAAPEGAYASYKYTREGSPLTLQAGVEPGDYELRYQSDREAGVFARIPITVTAMQITLEAPPEVTAGERFEVAWTGPAGSSDYLTLVLATASAGAYGEYHYVREGNPLGFTAPDEPGAYELRYQTDSEGVFYRLPITVK